MDILDNTDKKIVYSNTLCEIYSLKYVFFDEKYDFYGMFSTSSAYIPVILIYINIWQSVHVMDNIDKKIAYWNTLCEIYSSKYYFLDKKKGFSWHIFPFLFLHLVHNFLLY